MDTGIHYPIPVHKQPGLAEHEWRAVGDLATTGRLADEVLSLPLFPELGDESVRRICIAVERSLAAVAG
jgi:dTDP-4-amino-4,6-dideoxygalactose transaminase